MDFLDLYMRRRSAPASFDVDEVRARIKQPCNHGNQNQCDAITEEHGRMKQSVNHGDQNKCDAIIDEEMKQSQNADKYEVYAAEKELRKDSHPRG